MQCVQMLFGLTRKMVCVCVCVCVCVWGGLCAASLDVRGDDMGFVRVGPTG